MERSDSAGVEIVSNPGRDVPLPWAFRPTLSVGGADSGPEAFYQIDRSSVAAAPDGGIVVADAGNRRLIRFGPDGAILWVAGREGEGPGEFQHAASVAVTDAGVIVVEDPRRRAHIRFSLEGELLGETPMTEARPVQALPLPGGGRVFRGTLTNEDRTADRRFLARTTGGSTDTLVARTDVRPGMIEVLACGAQISLIADPVFSPDFLWAVGGDRVAVSWSWPEYRIDVYRVGSPVRSVRRASPPRIATRAMAVRELGDQYHVSFGPGRECDLDPRPILERRGVAQVLPAVGALALAPDGTLWVARRVVRGAEAPVDLFDADGTYLGTLPAAAPFPAAFLPDGSIAAVEEDELEVQRVVVYAVERPGRRPLP